MSSCPHLVVGMGGVKIPCLIDTGSMVSTITESCFLANFAQCGQERLRFCQWLQLRAANGLEIPYIGYLELDIELCGKVVLGCGVLVIKDPLGGLGVQVPGVLGMNILSRCYRELFGQHGLSLFSLSAVSGAPGPVMQALQHCQLQAQPSGLMSKVRVRGHKAKRISGGMMQIVAATCSEHCSGNTVLFEPVDPGLPAGLLVLTNMML